MKIRRGVPIVGILAIASLLFVVGIPIVTVVAQALAPSTKSEIAAKHRAKRITVTTSLPSLPPSTLAGDQIVGVPDAPPETAVQGIRYLRQGHTIIAQDASGRLATFTDGARTVALRGASRTFSEPGAESTVTHAVWVRLLPAPFAGVVDETWLQRALRDTSLDILATAMQYVAGSPTLTDMAGLVYAGDANYGPLYPSGSRQEGSDFNDYLGVTAVYDGVEDTPEPAQLGSIDCSGYMRMVWGYRNGVPMTDRPNAGGRALPRRAVQMYAFGPGTLLIAQGDDARAHLDELQPGDLVFFDASADDGAAVDHVGMYMGRDDVGSYRFISSRKLANGPTFGDIGGKSTLDGAGLYAKSFVAARRL